MINGNPDMSGIDHNTAGRLDMMLVSARLVSSRSKAQRLIRTGKVTVDGRVVTKPSAVVSGMAPLRVDKGEDYVSRGAYKLIGAFDTFGPLGLPEPRGRHCLDMGASTGGLKGVLRRSGAAQVIALDVGHGQLDPHIASDSRVIEMSGTNIRDVQVDDLPYRPDCIVSDVSFISLTYVLGPIARLAAPHAQVVLLVKPQFEVGRQGLGKNGIVEDASLRAKALDDVMRCARSHGLAVRGHTVSPIEGAHGNVEYLLWLTMR